MNEDEQFEQRARTQLRRLVADTPADLRARLDGMAERAAREAPRTTQRRLWRVAIPVGGGLAAALAMLMLRPADVAPVDGPSPAGDMALLLNVDNLDLLEQMEFYRWLESEPALLEGAGVPADAQRS
jgi:hypothetical protein